MLLRRALRPTAAATAAAGLFAAHVYREHEQWQQATADSACEASLPPVAEAQLTRVVRLPRWFSDDEIEQIHSLHDAVASKVGTSGRDAANQAAAYHTGVWEVSYLSTDGHFRAARPALLDKLIAAAHKADEQFNVLKRAQKPVKPRCVEYHVVSANGSLPFPHHHDAGSFLTVDVMLSDPSQDFTGGCFETLEADGSMTQHTFEKGDAMVFVSHKPHCVSQVRSGERRVLILELWEGEERTCGHRCERHWGECKHTASDSFWRRALSDIGSDL